MSNLVRIKRRAAGGAAGAPASLANAELAYNEQDDVLYYGFGTGGAGGTATTVKPIAGSGYVVSLNGSYANPSWITSLAGSKVTGDIAGNAANVTGTVALANGGTGAANAAGARTNLGLVIGTDVQAYDADLSAIGALAGTSGLLKKTAANTWTLDTATYLTANQTITFNGDLSGSGSTSVSLTLANSGVTAGTYNNSATAVTPITFDAKGRATGTGAAVTITPAWTSITGKPTTLSGYGITDAYTKTEVDTLVQGLDPKASVVAASTANIASLSGTMTIDGIALIAGDRVLLKDQSTASQNGVYVVSAGAWARAADMSLWSELPSAYLFVEKGTVNADIGYLCTVDQGGTLESTAITFVQFSGAGQIIAGAGLTKTGNQIDIATASSTRIVVNSDSIDLATIGTAGTYRSVTVDAYGRVSAGTNPTTLSGYGITDAQALDATLTALAGLTTAANQLIYSTGVDTFAMTSFTAFGRSLVDDADAATARSTLGLNSMAVQASDNVSISGGSITNLSTFDGVTVDCGTF
jgi:hypothetical protein